MSLTPELFAYLQTQHPVIIITVDADGWPCAELVSWVLAVDERTIRLAIGSQRRSVANARANSRLVVQLIGPGLACEIRGAARIIRERCKSVRFPQTLVELHVESIRENMYPANFVTDDVPVGWPESTNGHHQQWDKAIAEEMRAAEGRGPLSAPSILFGGNCPGAIEQNPGFADGADQRG